MTIEQLLSPAVWDHIYENRNVPQEKRLDEFNKWFADNIELVNESVNKNINEINERIECGIKRAQLLSEDKNIDLDNMDWDNINFDEIVQNNKSEEENVENSDSQETEVDDESQNTTIGGKVILTNSLKNKKHNIFSCINAFIDQIEQDEKFKNDPLPEIWGSVDVSGVSNMTALFAFADVPRADLSTWDVSKVKLMEGMFYKSSFNDPSICKWGDKVENCENFSRMFTYSDFNQSLKDWKYKMIEKKELDENGKPIRLSNGKFKVTQIPVNPPLIGANANEEAEIINKFWTDRFYEAYEKESVKKTKNVDLDDEIDESNEYNNLNKMKHIVDFETFVNEGFRDFVKKGINKVKSFFKSMTVKLGDFIATFDDKGDVIDAANPYTALNYISNGLVKGVKAFTKVKNEYLNDNVKSEGDIIQSPEYYGIIDKDSIEYQNYLTMVEMVNEHYAKYGDKLNEAYGESKRIGFPSTDGGLIEVEDIDSKDFLKHLNRIIKNTPYDKGLDYSKPILIWGAPGIGKSSIPNSVIKAWNEKNNLKKTLMVVECGNLTVDGFSLPMPVTYTIGDYLKENPEAAKLLRGEVGEIEKEIEKITIDVSSEAVKTWLPVYKISPNKKLNIIGNQIANSGTIERVEQIDNGKFRSVEEETTEGGIILFDEFFRANPQIFKILMQILLNRKFNNEFKLGDKWSILACSNRPADDSEVETSFQFTGAVIGTRFGKQYNFIPDFDEWKKWAVKHGHFDSYTLEFLSKKDPATRELTNWHTIRPDEYSKGKTGWPTPRTWAGLMVELHNIIVDEGYSSILDIPEKELRQEAAGAIGKKVANDYVNFLMKCKTIGFKPEEIFNNPEYEIPTNLTPSDVKGRVEEYINATFSVDNKPSDYQLTNMINVLGDVFTEDIDNIIRPVFNSIFTKFGFFKNPKEFITKFNDFTQKYMERYELKSPQELINFLRN